MVDGAAYRWDRIGHIMTLCALLVKPRLVAYPESHAVGLVKEM